MKPHAHLAKPPHGGPKGMTTPAPRRTPRRSPAKARQLSSVAEPPLLSRHVLWIRLRSFAIAAFLFLPAWFHLHAASIHWASSTQRICVGGPGDVTLTEIKAAVPNGPLCLLDATNHIWFLGGSLEITNGATLLLHGSAVGGDVNELLLRSDNSRSTNNLASVEADWGILDIQNTKVISWNELASAPDAEFAAYGRAFIRARSRLVGGKAQQSTLNVLNSEIGWLGSDSSDTYGLDWQVDGAAPGVTVFGTVSNCYIHDCQMGVADWYGNPIYGNTVLWAKNNLASNTLYGFDPTDPKQAVVVATNTVVSNSYGPIFRWSGSDDRIYTVGEGTVTLTDIHNALPTAPLVLVDPIHKIWELNANLYVTHGTKLNLYGPAIGGDVGQLRLKSDHLNGSNQIVQLRADYGWLDIENTKITSWNDALNGPDITTNIYTQPRSFVHARSTLDTNGYTAHQSRMDVYNSDIGYLGYHATEAYGLVWKVVDTTAKYIPTNSTNTLYDLVKVYGNITNSHLHNNCFGMYAYGHNGGIWVYNLVESNLAYGFDPHNYSDNLDIENNDVHDNGWHGIIASIGCVNGIIRSNLSHSNGRDLTQGRGNGIMLHRGCNGWTVEYNQSYNNRDSGIALFGSDSNLVSGNFFTSNANAGIRLSEGAHGNLVAGNQFNYSGGDGIYLFQGTNNPGPQELTARCYANIFSNNLLHGYGSKPTNGVEAIKVQDADSNLFTANLLSAASPNTNTLVLFDTGTNNTMAGNILPSDAVVILSGTTNTNGLALPRDLTTFLDLSNSLTLQLGNFATATLTNQNHAVFTSALGSLATTVKSGGSSASLSSAVQASIGTNTASPLEFFAVPSTKSAKITPVAWDPNGAGSKSWTVQATTNMSISYSIGSLLPGTNYAVTRSFFPITNVTADPLGNIAFALSVGSTFPVTYTVNPN